MTGPRHTVLTLIGEVDLAEVVGLRRAALSAVGAGRNVVVDLAEVTFLDACGLAALVWVRRAAHAAGLECHLVAPSRPVRRITALTRSEHALGWDLATRRRCGPAAVRRHRPVGSCGGPRRHRR